MAIRIVPNVAPAALAATDGGKNAPNMLSILGFPDELTDAQAQLSGAVEDVSLKTAEPDASNSSDEQPSDDLQNLPMDTSSAVNLAANIAPVAVPFWLMQPATLLQTSSSQGSDSMNSLTTVFMGAEPMNPSMVISPSNGLQNSGVVNDSGTTLELQPIVASAQQIDDTPVISPSEPLLEKSAAPAATLSEEGVVPGVAGQGAAAVKADTDGMADITSPVSSSKLALIDVAVSPLSKQTSPVDSSQQPEQTQTSEGLVLGKTQPLTTRFDSMPKVNAMPFVTPMSGEQLQGGEDQGDESKLSQGDANKQSLATNVSAVEVEIVQPQAAKASPQEQTDPLSEKTLGATDEPRPVQAEKPLASPLNVRGNPGIQLLKDANSPLMGQTELAITPRVAVRTGQGLSGEGLGLLKPADVTRDSDLSRRDVPGLIWNQDAGPRPAGLESMQQDLVQVKSDPSGPDASLKSPLMVEESQLQKIAMSSESQVHVALPSGALVPPFTDHSTGPMTGQEVHIQEAADDPVMPHRSTVASVAGAPPQLPGENQKTPRSDEKSELLMANSGPQSVLSQPDFAADAPREVKQTLDVSKEDKSPSKALDVHSEVLAVPNSISTFDVKGFNSEPALRLSPHQVRLDHPEVSTRILQMAQSGSGEVRIDVTPPDESTFKITLSVQSGQEARLVVTGASDSTRTRLDQTTDQLRQQFAQMGLNLNLDFNQSSFNHSRWQEAHVSSTMTTPTQNFNGETTDLARAAATSPRAANGASMINLYA